MNTPTVCQNPIVNHTAGKKLKNVAPMPKQDQMNQKGTASDIATRRLMNQPTIGIAFNDPIVL